MPNFEPRPDWDNPGPDGCPCPQDYVARGCPVHDPDGTYYPPLDGTSEIDALRAAVSLTTAGPEVVRAAWNAIENLAAEKERARA